jgi:hypothetical protein
MGQLIAFPTSLENARANPRSDSPSDPARRPPRRVAVEAAPRKRERPRPALELLYGLTYALGLFLAAPVLVLVAFDGVFAGEPLTSLGALVLLALVLPLAAAARRRV